MTGTNAKHRRSKRLADRQRVFVEEYLICWNASEAARRAGYRQRSNQAGHRLVTNCDIRAEIQRRLAEIAMDAAEVLARLSDQARGDLGDFINDEGKIDLDKARKLGKMHLLKSYTRSERGERIELHDVQAALIELGRHYGLFRDDCGVQLNIDMSQLTDEQLERIASGESPIKVLADRASPAA